jgi:hypothetical protein
VIGGAPGNLPDEKQGDLPSAVLRQLNLAFSSHSLKAVFAFLKVLL